MMMTPNQETLQKAEQQLMSSALNASDQFVVVTMNILAEEAVSVEVKKCAVIILKKILTMEELNTKCIYPKLGAETRELFKKQMLIIMVNTSDESLSNNIGDMIGTVAGHLVENTEHGGWPNLVEHMVEMFGLNNPVVMSSVFRILEGLISYSIDFVVSNKTQMMPIFALGFDCTNSKVLSGCLMAATSLVELARPKDIRELKALNLKYLEGVARLYEMKKFEEMEKAVGCLFDICEMEPSFFKQRFDQVAQLVGTIRSVFSGELNNNFKDQTVECLIMMIERYPEIVKTKKKLEEGDDPLNFITRERLDKVVELIFMNMVEVSDQIDPEWACPPDGFNDDLEEDDDQKNIKNGMNFIDRLIQVLGKNLMLKYLSGFIEKMMSVESWKYKLAALMALSQVGEYMIDKMEDIRPILELVNSYIENENPRLRYACCHVLGQFADDLKPKFQELYHAQFFQIVLPRLDDPIPRVKAHCLAALTNFLEYSEPEQVSPVFDHVFNKTTNILLSGITYEKENAMSALASLAESSPKNFEKFYDQMMKILLQILGTSAKKEFRQMRGQSIEAITIISEQMPRARFNQFVPELIKLMVSIQNHDVAFGDVDPQKSYLLAGYQRLCKILGKDLVPFLGDIIPGLIKMAEAPLISAGDNMLGVKSYEKEEAEIAVQMLDVFIECLGENLGPFLMQIFRMCTLLMDYSLSEDTKLIAADCLPSLVSICKKTNCEQYATFAKQVCKKLWLAMEQEHEPEILEDQARSLQRVIEEAGDIYSTEELQELYSMCIAHLKKSEVRKVQTQDVYDEEEEDQKDIAFLVKEENNIEEQFTCQIAEIFGAIFKSHKQKALPIVELLYQNYILKAVNPKMPPKIIKFGLFLIDDSIDHLGEFLSQELLHTFYGILIVFATHEILEVRHAATYGLGAFALCLGPRFVKYFDETIKVVTMVHEIKNVNEDQHEFCTTKENIISTIGKMLKVTWAVLSRVRLYKLLCYWLNNLPLTRDVVEGIVQHDFFADVLLSEAEFVLGPNIVNLQQILKIICQIYYNQLTVANQDIMKKLVTVVKTFVENNVIKAQLANFQFTEQERVAIENLATGKSTLPQTITSQLPIGM